MKNTIKKIFLITIITISLVYIYPYNTYALNEEISYNDITDIENLEIGDLSFSNIKFENYSRTSTQAFGLAGEIFNNSNNPVSYDSTVYYYDSDYNLITKTFNSGIVLSGTNHFNQMTNSNILGEYSVDDISYYRLLINISDSASITTNPSNSIPSENSLYSSYDYVIDNYDVNIIVNENNTFDITETITAYFNVPKHGIFRTIPLKNKITRLDGTSSSNRTQVTNLSVDNEYSTSKENGNYKVQIGSANRTLTGKQTYTIKYTYNLGKDHIKDYDELYYNIIGTEWDTVIGNISFTITMPKKFDSSKLGFSSGAVGSTDNSNIKYTVNGNSISGSYNGILDAGEALTVRCELPEGYFVDAGFIINPSVYFLFLIPIISLIISLFLWYKFGRDNQVIETVEFYPPAGFNSLEVGFLYKGKANNKDATSLLIYLANKGYLKISEIEEESLFSKLKAFKITKLKDYDGNNANEKIFFNELFTKTKVSNVLKGDIVTYDINEVTSAELYNNFYTTIKKILSNINNRENKNKIFEKNSFKKSIIIILLMLISLVTIIIIPTMEYASISEFGMTLFICLFYIPFFAVGIFVKIPLLFRIFWLGFVGIHSIIVFGSLPIGEAIANDFIYLIGVILGLICLIGMIICLKLMPKRTSYGNEMLGKLRGFKNFLETAEKDKLESMVMENPTYFYDILPYTYVLGVSDKWIKKFETISMQAPSWYDSPNAFDIVAFGTFLSSTMTSAQSVMSSSSSSSGSDGSSGGGSSGGGSGGGGGGSW